MEQTPTHANDSLLGSLQRTLRFWIVTLSACFLTFIVIGLIYGVAVKNGLISTENIFITFFVLVAMVGSWWLIGEWMKLRYNYGS